MFPGDKCFLTNLIKPPLSAALNVIWIFMVLFNSSSNNFISIKSPPGWKFNKKLNRCERYEHDLILPTFIPRPCKCIPNNLRVNN